VSGITEVGTIVVRAGGITIDTSSGGFLNVDQPISREMADLVEQTITREGLTPDEVFSVEFRGEGQPIIASTNEAFQRRHAEQMRAAYPQGGQS
jgi:hypothetical protein